MSHFKTVMARKSDSELEGVMNSGDKYVEEAKLAAALELKSRGLLTDQNEQLVYELAQKLKSKQEVDSFEKKFFSKNLIYLLAFCFTPILIGPFMAYNIWEMGNRKGIKTVVIQAILYLPLMLITFYLVPIDFAWLAAIIHMGYSVFFVEWTWKKYLPTFEDYKKTESTY